MPEKEYYIQRYCYEKDKKIIELEDRKIIIIKKTRYDLEKVYQKLKDHNITTILYPLAIDQDNVYFPFVEDKDFTSDEKAKKMVYDLAIWQNKMTSHMPLDVDKIKKTYEYYKKEITTRTMYYKNMQAIVETKVYMSPSEYVFIRHSSILFSAFAFCQTILEKWYEEMMQKKNDRYVYCHGSFELNHFLTASDGYFLHLENAHEGSPTDDFANFYRKNYQDVDMISTFHFYQLKYPFTPEENLFFQLQIVLPEKIEIYPSNLATTKKLTYFYDYLIRTNEFISAIYQKEQPVKKVTN